jgi:hypothetical protein
MSGKIEFERVPYLTCTAMSAKSAEAFLGGEFFKVVCVGQARSDKYRFGARTYRLFKTVEDWNRYLKEKRAKP